MKERNEQTENEKNKDKDKDKKKKSSIGGEKKFYLYTAIACATALLAIVITAVAVTNTNQVDKNNGNGNSVTSDTSSDASGNDKPVVVVPEGMVLPISSATAENDYGFYYNQSVGAYYEHKGIDFIAMVGTEVVASEDGTIESIYKDDLLLGTEIVIDHGDGLKTVYRFITETDGLKVGAKVSKGEVIATVAEANGNEYKEGAHLHFEVLKNGQSVDPIEYITLEEK